MPHSPFVIAAAASIAADSRHAGVHPAVIEDIVHAALAWATDDKFDTDALPEDFDSLRHCGGDCGHWYREEDVSSCDGIEGPDMCGSCGADYRISAAQEAAEEPDEKRKRCGVAGCLMVNGLKNCAAGCVFAFCPEHFPVHIKTRESDIPF